LAFILEHTPWVRELCGMLYIWARKPGSDRQLPSGGCLATHPQLTDTVSVIVPCHNEEMNIPRLVDGLMRLYGPYIHEIIIVNDNSKDGTAAVTREIAAREPRVRLIDRQPPNGVGRALRDGYAAATGRYILSMDSDFLQILPEVRDLFDVIAAGHDGAIGSRFSPESLLINYPFFKILCNRTFHFLANLLLPIRMRDISNNLKLYRSHIFKELDIEEGHFAANAETGLKPLMAGYDIQEVPTSWINRTIDMGTSTFRIFKVAPNYFAALFRVVSTCWFRRRSLALRKPEC
jgi:dolichol-phosphate mannosyltransferase